MSQTSPPRLLLRAALVSLGLGVGISLVLLIRETPWTLVAFMFLAQPLIGIGVLMIAIEVVRDLRTHGVL